MNNTQKNVLIHASALVAGLALNKVIDNKLAQSENPGRVNRWYRKQLKKSRSPWYVGLSVLMSAAFIALEHEASNGWMQEAMEEEARPYAFSIPITCSCGTVEEVSSDVIAEHTDSLEAFKEQFLCSGCGAEDRIFAGLDDHLIRYAR